MSDLSTAGMVTEIHGSGPAVVMLHGLGGSSNTFEPLMPTLSGFRVIRPDLPGAARSLMPGGLAGQLSVATICAAVIRLCQTLGVTQAHFVGHSKGTLLCQSIAVTAPELVGSLSLFGALYEPAEPNRQGLRARAADVRANGMADCADAIVAGSVASHTHESNPAAAAFVRESIMRQDPIGYAANCESLANAQKVDLRKIQSPMLIVTGRDDTVTPVSMGQQIADQTALASLHVIERCGHWTPIEKPVECAAHLRHFLSSPGSKQ